MGLACQQKQLKTPRKQLKTADSNSPGAYIQEVLLSEGYLHLRFGGLIFGRAYLGGSLLSEFAVSPEHR